MEFELRGYQKNAVKSCIDYLHGPSNDPVVLLGPTASGKSLIISSVAKDWGKPVLVLQPSQELLEQNLGKLRMLGGNAAVFSASLNSKELDLFTYATLGSIKDQAEALKKLGVELVLIDECDCGFPPEPGSQRPFVKPSMFMKFIQELKPKKVIGFTATPIYLRTNMEGSQLKVITRVRPKYFKHFVHVIQIQELTSQGFWSKLRYNSYLFDESGLSLNTSGAEFSDESIQKVLEEQNVNRKICIEVKRLLKENAKNILVFMDSLENCQKITEWLQTFCTAEFLGSGITNKKERKRIVDGFKANEIQVLVNHRILTVGFDKPDLEHIVLGYPTNSLRLYYQIIGRGTRIHPDKTHCNVHDFCGNVGRFGKVENLTFENIPSWGWGFFNGDIALTNVPMGGLKVTRQKLLNRVNNKVSHSEKLWFGTRLGTPIEDLPISYMRWMLLNHPFRGPRMENLKKTFLTLIEEDSKIKFL